MHVLVWLDRDVFDVDKAVNAGYKIRFTQALKPIVADWMSINADGPDRDIIEPGKVDVLDVRPLADSDTKKVVIHVYGYPDELRVTNMPGRLTAIASDVKKYFGLPVGEQCVSVSFKRVERGDWAKA